MADAKILYMRPANARRAGVRNLPTHRVPALTRRFLDTLTPAVIYTNGYRWVGGGHNWRLDLSLYGIEYIDPTGTEPGYWELYGDLPEPVRVADPAEAIAWLRDHGRLPDPKAGA